MAKGDRSEFTELVDAISDRMLEIYDSYLEAWGVIPFMQEQITKEEYKRRFRAMLPIQRLAEMQRLGTEEVLRLMAE